MHVPLRHVAVIAILCGVFMLGGCRAFNVDAFGVPIHRPGQDPALVVAAKDDTFKLTTEEKLGVVLLIAVGVAAVIVAAN